MVDPVSNLAIAPEQLENFCRRWNVTELALFGSVLRNDFMPQSDVDVLVTSSREQKSNLLTCCICKKN